MKHQIDLHIHSKYSDDGEYEPEELVEMCHQKGIKVMAIADHNQVKAIKAARKKAEEYGIRYISAIEIDCTYKDINLHVLGYNIPEDEPYFQTLNDKIYDQELSLSNKKIELTKKLGFNVTKEELDQLSRQWSLYRRNVCRGDPKQRRIQRSSTFKTIQRRRRQKRQSICKLLLGFLRQRKTMLYKSNLSKLQRNCPKHPKIRRRSSTSPSRRKPQRTIRNLR